MSIPVANPEDRFSCDVAHLCLFYFSILATSLGEHEADQLASGHLLGCSETDEGPLRAI